MTEEQNRPCNGCGAQPGQRHLYWDDLARCRSTGLQLIQCQGELHEYLGVSYGEHKGACGPDIWDGEYPGVKFCRAMGWYTDPLSVYGVTEDLNFLAVAAARGLVMWDRDQETYVVPDKAAADQAQQEYQRT